MSASDQQESAESPRGPETPAIAKKAWRKPTYRFERVFETQALTCGKTATQGQCRAVRKS
jgi:hypothetical protein